MAKKNTTRKRNTKARKPGTRRSRTTTTGNLGGGLVMVLLPKREAKRLLGTVPMFGAGNVGGFKERRGVSDVIAAGVRGMQRGIGVGKRGRRAENIVPIVKRIPTDLAPNVQHTFGFLTRHKKAGGITLKALVEVMKLPYSTVQAQVNKLVAMGAAKKQMAAAA